MHEIDQRTDSRRRLTKPQQFVAVLIPVGVVLMLALSLLNAVPSVAKRAAIKLGVYDEVQGGLFGVHPWTWAHLIGWMAFAAAVAVAVVLPRRAALAAVGLFALSVVVEVMQDLLTSKRGFSGEDVVANGVGIALGLAFGLVFTHVWATQRSVG